jgi:hypothetical protein
MERLLDEPKVSRVSYEDVRSTVEVLLLIESIGVALFS